MPAALAAPATFDENVQARRALLAKVHIAKKQLQLLDDDYRSILIDVTGRSSAADCTLPDLLRLVERFRARGFRDLPGKGKASGARPADHPAARKARALWISLHQLGAIHNPSEAALEAFAARQLGVAKMQWVNQALMYKLVEALKAIAERNGWDQDTSGLKPGGVVLVLKRRLCDAILVKLKAKGLAAEDWSIEQAAWSLTGLRKAEGDSALFWEMGDLDLVAKGFGRKLRGEA